MTNNNTKPFRMPDGYLDSLETAVNERINRKPGRAWSVLKPALGLACSFAVIFGMGYGIISLTGTLKGDEKSADTEIIDQYLTYSSHINYFESEEDEEESIHDEEILDYLATEMSQSAISDYFAQQQ